MHLLDNFIRGKFLEDISDLFKKYGIEDNLELLDTIWRNLYFREHSHNFKEDIRKIYINLYQINFTISEVLAIKQQLDTERQVFSVVKNYISKNNIRLTFPNIINIYISHKNEELIQHPDLIQLFSFYEPVG